LFGSRLLNSEGKPFLAKPRSLRPRLEANPRSEATPRLKATAPYLLPRSLKLEPKNEVGGLHLGVLVF
jgi:hypothetical protein